MQRDVVVRTRVITVTTHGKKKIEGLVMKSSQLPGAPGFTTTPGICVHGPLSLLAYIAVTTPPRRESFPAILSLCHATALASSLVGAVQLRCVAGAGIALPFGHTAPVVPLPMLTMSSVPSGVLVIVGLW